FAGKIRKALQSDQVRLYLDDSNETLGKRIREATLKKIPYVLVIGQKELEASQVSVRKRGGEDLGSMSLDSFQTLLRKEIVDKK
ncbi:MAG: threonine--tRNA ligase, partial [Candidatus Omnitrophica bacterium]|nr:threonine--tRNA ligase [Candidatus Omnitrophota bacterium]